MSEPFVPTVDDTIKLPTLSDVQISPAGESVAYVVTTPDFKENKHISQIWLVANENDAKPRQLTFTKHSSSTPCWSPDGRSLAFISRRGDDKVDQIYRLSLSGGEAECLTKLESGPTQLAWSPDGQSIAFLAPDPESEADKARKEKYGEYIIENEDYTYSHLWLLTLKDNSCMKLTSGTEFNVRTIEWAPDSQRIAFSGSPTPDMDRFHETRIYTIDCEKMIVQTLTNIHCDNPKWSPDGAQIAFMRGREPVYYKNNDLCLIAADGGEPTKISSTFDENMRLLGWAEDGFYFAALQRTDAHLYRMDTQGQVTQLTPNQAAGWVSLEGTFTKDYGMTAVIQEDAAHLEEIVTIDTHTGQFTRLTNFTEAVREWHLPQPEIFRWTSSDGTEIEGTLTRPASFDPEKQYPLLVIIHGGPAWASQSALLPTLARRIYPWPLWLAKEAIILQPNYRGSRGYGEAFASLNVRNLGVGDYEDVISGVDALIDRGWVDPNRMGAMGWSQGGYISMFLATNSDRFKALSCGAGISNWVTYYVNTDVHPFTRQYLEAAPWDDPDIYARTSPMTNIKRACTPTLIQHGRDDSRVPVPNAYELYQGLLDVGVETRLVTYPGMPHGPQTPGQRRQIMEDNLAWFNRWLWDEVPKTEEKRPCLISLATEDQAESLDEIPVLERYTTAGIRQTYHQARRADAEFRILSVTYGLLAADTAVGPDPAPTITIENVTSIAKQIARQIEGMSVSKLVLVSDDGERPSNLMALGCLQLAAALVGDIKVETQKAG